MIAELLEKFEDLFTPITDEELGDRNKELIDKAIGQGMKDLKAGDSFMLRPASKVQGFEYEVKAVSKIFVSSDWDGEANSAVIYRNPDGKLLGASWRSVNGVDYFWYPTYSTSWTSKHKDKIVNESFEDIFKPASADELDQREAQKLQDMKDVHQQILKKLPKEFTEFAEEANKIDPTHILLFKLNAGRPNIEVYIEFSLVTVNGPFMKKLGKGSRKYAEAKLQYHHQYRNRYSSIARHFFGVPIRWYNDIFAWGDYLEGSISMIQKIK